MDEVGRSRELRQLIRRRKKEHAGRLASEIDRLTREAIAIGVSQIILFGSLARGEARLTSDIDLFIVWDTELDYLTRTAELYRRLQPRVAVDLLVYTPEEFSKLRTSRFVRSVTRKGNVLYAA
jgi:uncharacterized protein